MGRLLFEALQTAGHQVSLASAWRSWDDASKPGRQSRLTRLMKRKADQLLVRQSIAPPDLWFSYHPYHKAPDWLGPYLSQALGIPYVMAETSLSPSQSNGPWHNGHQATQAAIEQAAAIISLNERDIPCLLPHLKPNQQLVRLRPFIKLPIHPEPSERAQRLSWRRKASKILPGHHPRLDQLELEQPWLLTVAMMRSGDKQYSYTLLAESLKLVLNRQWRLLIVGDGPARALIEKKFAQIPANRLSWIGAIDQPDLWRLYAVSDLMVWPAINEAYCMAILEAHVSGLAVVAGYTSGVAQIVRDGASGLLTPTGKVEDFAAAVAKLLDDPPLRIKMGEAARVIAKRDHSFQTAVEILDHTIRHLVP